MTTRHLVDPELLPVLDLAPPMSLSIEGLPEVRARIGEMTQLSMLLPADDMRITEHIVSGLNGAPSVRVLLYRPTGLAANAPVLLRIHGGGFLFGSAEMGDPRSQNWARQLGCVIASLDYRLAPEMPFPGALEDCFAVLLWLHDRAAELGFDPGRIAIRGESAGGGLAAALALMARDRGGPKIIHQTLIYPMLDDRTGSGAARNPTAGEFIWDAAANILGWSALLGTAPGGKDVHPYAAPARATDLKDLPPTFLGTAMLDIFIDENLEYARRLIHAGVPTEVYVAPGAYHGFDAMMPDAAIAQVFTERGLDALRRAFAG